MLQKSKKISIKVLKTFLIHVELVSTIAGMQQINVVSASARSSYINY
jgi:hypothetical protein